ncbi:putative Ig domain-containing protein [Lysinibacter sp. HNR]|uniref:Ig-like domain-containing protein n=1 Tax=Lysinibacter sp. HNR TaxID=3031408 RepID=UPI002435E019|nr:putative Ig domain-containing protein [Lysinibacter sp. HNR]WGD37891.1 hypothetical protein FrondiHNR_02970 [Lysinibacter sp. HNR]
MASAPSDRHRGGLITRGRRRPRGWALGSLLLGVVFICTVLLAGAPDVQAQMRAGATVSAWGLDDHGQVEVPAELVGRDVVAVAAGYAHSLALVSDGSVVAWGLDDHGQVEVPAELVGRDVVAVAAGYAHSLALVSDGSVVAWGRDNHGQVEVPAELVGRDVVAVAAGYAHSLALVSDGSVVAWGRDNHGQAQVPDALTGREVTAIAAGSSHSLALVSDGSVVAWGLDDHGQVEVPAELVGRDVVAVAAGYLHSLALMSDGSLVTWGYNFFGLLDIPAEASNRVFTSIAAGFGHAVALTQEGDILVWGWNGRGQLNVPVEVANKTATSIAAGYAHSLVTFQPDRDSTLRVSLGYELADGVSTHTASVTVLHRVTQLPVVNVPVDFNVFREGDVMSTRAFTGQDGISHIEITSTVAGEHEVAANIHGETIDVPAGGNRTARFGTMPVLEEAAFLFPAGEFRSVVIPVTGIPSPVLRGRSLGDVLPQELPTGLILDSVTGVLSGTLTEIGKHVFEINAENELGTNLRVYTVMVTPPASEVVKALPSASSWEGSPQELSVTGTGGVDWFIVAGLALLVGGAGLYLRGTAQPPYSGRDNL